MSFYQALLLSPDLAEYRKQIGKLGERVERDIARAERAATPADQE